MNERDKIEFDSVTFWDMAGERHMKPPSDHSIKDIALVPLPGDRVSFGSEEAQFAVVYREFRFRPGGVCHVMVNLQPASREVRA